MPDGSDDGHHSWQHTDRGPYIKVWSGRKVYLGDPQPGDFTIDDIAHHLAGIYRYTGGSRFTVAQHCVVAARMAERFYQSEELLPARMLIHDADEAYIGDVSSPLKSLLPDYINIEQKMQLAMESFFDTTFIGDPLVREIDYRMWLTERAILFGGRHGPQSSDYQGPLSPFPLLNECSHYFEEWDSSTAEEEWLFAHRRLFCQV
jgi:hypothetical protein